MSHFSKRTLPNGLQMFRRARRFVQLARRSDERRRAFRRARRQRAQVESRQQFGGRLGGRARSIILGTDADDVVLDSVR